MEILIKIQKELKAPKNQFNLFGKYKYRSCEDILEAVKPLLGKATLTISDEIVMLGERFYVKATAVLYDGEKTATVSAFAREAFDKKGMDAAQITGSASSYARKYALNGLFLIDDNEDSDTPDSNVDLEKIKAEVEKIKDVDELREYYKKNKGLGKEVSEFITNRSTKLKKDADKK